MVNPDAEFWDLVKRIDPKAKPSPPPPEIETRIRWDMYDFLRELRMLVTLVVIAACIIATIILVADAFQNNHDTDPRKETVT